MGVKIFDTRPVLELAKIKKNGKMKNMDNEKRRNELKEEKYQVIFGISKSTFETMHTIVESAYKEMRKKGGKKRKLSVLDMLVITLGYYHDYRTMENIAFDYGVHKQRISEAVAFVETALYSVSKRFS